MYKYVFAISISLFCVSVVVAQSQDDAKVYISKSLCTVEFDLKKDGEIHATMEVKRKFKSKTALSYTVSERVYFDEESEVKNTKIGRYKIQPIISDYESDGIFHSDLKLCYFEHEFDGIGEDVILSYEKIFKDIKYLDPLYFADRYEIDETTIEIIKPDWLELNIIEWNFDQDVVTKTESIDGDETIYTYQMKDLNSYADVKGLPNRSKVFPHLILNPTAATIKKKKVNLLRDAGDLYSWYAGLVSEIGNEPAELQTLVAELTTDKTADLEKIKSIYYWVQDNIRYIAFENGIMGFRPESCQSVLANRYGDCKGMANLTKEMLTLAGYDARLTWIGTSSLPYDYNVPSLLVDNHMICTVMLDGQEIFLDATEKNADIHYYASRIQGKQVMIENGDQHIISRVPVDKLSDSESYQIDLVFDEDRLVGSGKVEMSGGRKGRMAYYLSSVAAKDQQEFLSNYMSNQDKNVEIDITSTDLAINRDKDYSVSFDIALANKSFVIGDEIYFNPEFDFAFQSFEKFEDRDIPYDMSEIAVMNSEMKIKMPDGYTMSYLPSPIWAEGDGYDVQLSYELVGDVIHYNRNISIKEEIMHPSAFDDWNTVIDQLKTFYSDQVILKKS